ncbi:glycosyl transferase [Sphingobium amiense]|uniref:Glycosyl transferase n=1 Tax=Sphingobium amiense TaxID=135719 RepID=A0A494WAK5_9SPHN|nr:acyltransferase family protein [Sphingobium amiense]BBD97505.1 glycosyl transferase [Sphingobium amiense]
MDNRGEQDGRPRPATERLDWVDVARGIGIVAVVVGHVWTRGSLRGAMYSFHMPLFFLLSGMLARPQPAGPFARRLAVTQMRPYAAWLLLLILADQIIERAKGGVPIFHRWPEDVLPILLGGSWLRGPFTIFWFVPCLVGARILFNLILSRSPDPFDRRWTLTLPPLLASAYVLGWWTQASPLGLLTVPMAVVLLWAGLVWGRVGWHRAMLLPLALLAIVGLAGLVPTLNMKAANYGAPLLSIAAGVATSLLIFRLSMGIAPFAAPLASLGRASLTIMYLHVAIIHYLTPYLGKPWLLVLALAGPWGLSILIARSPTARWWLA